MDDVLRFINKITKNGSYSEVIDIFDNEFSYWFSLILFRRFVRDGAKIVFNNNTNKFGTKISDKVYTIRGISITDKWILWTEFKNDELKNVIINKYILF